MAARSEVIKTMSADGTSWNAYSVDDELIRVTNPGSNLFSGDKTPGQVFQVNGGGGGNHLKVQFSVFWREHYDDTKQQKPDDADDNWVAPPTELEENVAIWEEIYGKNLNGQDGWATNITVVDEGIGWGPGDTVKTVGEVIEFVLDKMTDNGWNLGDDFGRAGKAFWENNYIDTGNWGSYMRQLKGVTSTPFDKGDKSIMGVHGWQYLFTNDKPITGYQKYGVNATDTTGLQFMIDKSMSGVCNIVLGSPIAHQYNTTQRWATPKGVSFCWNNRHSRSSGAAGNEKSMGLRLKEMILLYKFGDEQVTRQVPLIYDYEFVDKGNIEYDNHLEKNQPGDGKAGVVQAWMNDEDYAYLHEKQAMCIGTQIRYHTPKQTTQSDNVVNIFNYRFLFTDKNYSKSRMILPSPATMVMAQSGNRKL